PHGSDPAPRADSARGVAQTAPDGARDAPGGKRYCGRALRGPETGSGGRGNRPDGALCNVPRLRWPLDEAGAGRRLHADPSELQSLAPPSTAEMPDLSREDRGEQEGGGRQSAGRSVLPRLPPSWPQPDGLRRMSHLSSAERSMAADLSHAAFLYR